MNAPFRAPMLSDLEAELARRDFHFFFQRFAWPILQPATPFKDNWHISAICEHLTAIKLGQIQKLLINMPFRHLKSSLVSHAFPAWDWIDNPSRQFLTSSYSKDISTRDAVDTRRIIESAEYQAAFGHRFKMTGDQNVKSRYENDKRGMRTVTSTDGAGTGFGGDIRIVDDPVSAKEADSPLALAASVEWWKGTMATRANDPSTGAAIVVHQRLNSGDLTGYLLENEDGWEHLVLPFRYDPKFIPKPSSIGFVDPRKIEGELIHPGRIPEKVAQDLEKTLGTYHKNAQLQQNPEPRGGIIFKRDDWQFWKVLPELDEIVVSIDCTFKSLSTSDHVAIQAWGNKGANDYLLPGRVKERMGFGATVTALRTFVAAVSAKYPNVGVTAVLVEDKANGSAVIETLTDEIAGVLPINPEGGKAARAFAMQPSCEAGNVWLPDPSVDPTIEEFIGTCSKFTGAEGGDDDEVDSMTQYCNWRRVRGKSMGLVDYMRQQQEAKMKESA